MGGLVLIFRNSFKSYLGLRIGRLGLWLKRRNKYKKMYKINKIRNRNRTLNVLRLMSLEDYWASKIAVIL